MAADGGHWGERGRGGGVKGRLFFLSICPHCQSEMGIGCIWRPTYVVIYDEGEVSKRGTYASIAPRAGP